MHHITKAPLFVKQFGQLGAIPRASEVVAGIVWAISSKPDDFPIMRSTDRLHLAKSEKIARKPSGHVRLYVWFTIVDESNVELLSIEIVPVLAAPYSM